MTFIYLFDLNMSNIKSEALAQELQKKDILKNSAEPIEKQEICEIFKNTFWKLQQFRRTFALV